MSSHEQFLSDVVGGLHRRPKQLPCKYLYDEHGSRLFDAICETEEYYLTRTELAIMEESAWEMGQQIGPGVMLVEYGSGSSVKTKLLLDHLPQPVAYVPVDISGDHLRRTADRLMREYPHIEVLPVCADFTRPFALPQASQPVTHAAVFFPGSTIGNFTPAETGALLAQIADLCGTGGGLLIGIDLRKEKSVIEAAYNDRSGITDAFSLNLLARINSELGGDFDRNAFRHVAYYNDAEHRVEIFIESTRDQSVRINGHTFPFGSGERILTEYSHKYTVEQFAKIAARAGLTLRRAWTDPMQYFAVLHFALLGHDTRDRSNGKNTSG